jgi:BASS family bile acid:Na+ symporter
MVGLAAGSPFLPRANQIVAEKRAVAGTLGVLLTVLSTFYIPVIAPFLMPNGAGLNRIYLLMAFIAIILIPLGLALYLRPGRENKVAIWLPWLDRTSYGAFFAAFIGVIFVFSDKVTGIIGYGGLAAIILFILAAFGIGYLLDGNDAGMRGVLAFGTAQRNLAVALVLPLFTMLSYNFIPGSPMYDPNVLIMILTLGIAGMIILLLLSKKLAKQGSLS